MNAAPTPSELREARAQLLARADVRGAQLRAALSDLTDDWLSQLLGDADDVALVAVGGYGRREPAPGSDLDLVLVHRGRRDIAAVADAIWYPVWDSGVGLDHSVRTVTQAASVAREDLKAALGLLDARHVAGDARLSEELVHTVRTQWRADATRRLPELVRAVAERAAAYGELAFLLEPDLKECRGGLRDVHAMFAAAAAWVVDAPSATVRAAHTVLLDVRGELHRRADGRRAGDRLLLQEQDGVAQSLSYADADVLMTAVYAAGRTIAFALDEVTRRVTLATAKRPRRGRPPQRRPLAHDVVEQDGEVVLARSVDTGDPVLTLRAAAAAAQNALPLAPHTVDRLAREVPDLPLPWPDEARRSLLAVLGAGRPAVAVLETLDQSGLLVRMLPEWERVRYRPQRNAYHRFTVDRHLVEAAVEAAAHARRVGRPDLLLFGALLHDIGKGAPGDHSEVGASLAVEVGERIGLARPDVGTLRDLVGHHLLLPDTATRRDPDDPATVRTVVEAVHDRETLALLHALAAADGLATGPAAWSDWKAGLVADLVRRADAVLAGAPHPAAAAERPEPTAAQREVAARGEVGVELDGPILTVVAPDRPGLLWRWAGVLALNRLDVLSASATSSAGTAVTSFAVEPRFGSEPDWDVVRGELRRAFEDPSFLGARLAERERAYRRGAAPQAPARVLFPDDASDVATVVEVRAHDSVGLLHRVARALAECDLDVRSARVSTLGAEAVDTFYVVGRDGRVVTEEAVREQIARAVLAAVGG